MRFVYRPRVPTMVAAVIWQLKDISGMIYFDHARKLDLDAPASDFSTRNLYLAQLFPAVSFRVSTLPPTSRRRSCHVPFVLPSQKQHKETRLCHHPAPL